jgi:hypothetical protein
MIKAIYLFFCKRIKRVFREDLQLHFLWSYFLTMLAVFWPIMIVSGVVATLIKEGLDLWSKGRWNWDDVIFGVVGAFAAWYTIYGGVFI